MTLLQTERSSITLNVSRFSDVVPYSDNVLSEFQKHPDRIIKLCATGTAITKAVYIANRVMRLNDEIVYRALSQTVELTNNHMDLSDPEYIPERKSRMKIILMSYYMANEHYSRPNRKSSVSDFSDLV